jgi:hypothetical protein
MKYSQHLKRIYLFPVTLLLSFFVYSQECIVEHEHLKGSYTGDCKKGKASGKGKAVGLDTYEGEFKSGLPDGKGIYTWQDGTVYTGKYSKGLRDGKGMMTFKKPGRQDSIMEGFWKKDVYIGKNEKPYIVHGKTGSVRDVQVEFSQSNTFRVKVIVTNTTGGVKTPGGEMPRYRVDNVQVLKGSYERLTSLESHLKSTETSLTEVNFPFRAKLNIGREEVEVELFEAGNYLITISINQ